MSVDRTVEKPVKKAAEKGEEILPLGKRVMREVLSWVWVILAFLFIHGTIVQARVIPSPSMEGTLLIGDHLLVSRFGYDAEVPFTGLHASLWRDPQRQQVIVFRAPLPGNQDFIKRIIGVPGDVVEVRPGQDHASVWINGKALTESYLTEPMSPHESFGPVTVPPRHYFVMGDNRANSFDGRYWPTDSRFVPRENILGTPVIIYMSVEADELAWQPWHVRERFLAYLGAVIHPSTVRWSRLFTTF
jgi:signal peptidase I